MENVLIRKATSEDAHGKGYVHYTSWIETYTGHFPQIYIDRLSLENSVRNAREHPENTFVALVGNEVIGFSCYMEARDDDLDNTGEIVAIYILQKYQGFGIGRKLMNACYNELKQYSKFCVWVLKSNLHSIRFYELQGFELDGKTKMIYEREVVRMIKENRHTTINR